MDRKLKLFKVALLVDLLDIELVDINEKEIIDPVVSSKFRNIKRSVKSFGDFSNSKFEGVNIQESFGDFSDKVNSLINKEINSL